MTELKQDITLIVHGIVTKDTKTIITDYLNKGYNIIYSGIVNYGLDITHPNLLLCYSNFPDFDTDGRNTFIKTANKGLSASKTKFSWLIKSDELMDLDNILLSFDKNKRLMFTKKIYDNIPLACDLSLLGYTKDLLKLFSCDLDSYNEDILVEPETYVIMNYLDFYSTAVMDMRLRWRQYLTCMAQDIDIALKKSNTIMKKYFCEFDNANKV